MVQQLYALKRDLDMLTSDVNNLKRSYNTVDFIAHTIKNMRDEQICQGEQMRRLEQDMKFRDKQMQCVVDDVSELKARVSQLEVRVTKIEVQFTQFALRLEEFDARLSNVEARLDKVETRLENVEAHLAKVETTVEKLVASVGRLEAGLAKIAAHFNIQL